MKAFEQRAICRDRIMKKIINKLFEWLGYVPKKRYKVLSQDDFFKQLDPCKHEVLVDEQIYMNNKVKKNEELVYQVEQHDYFILCRINEYCVIPYKGGFLVTDYCEKTDTHRMVKFFIDLQDEEYAKLCAEELCEKLNERM